MAIIVNGVNIPTNGDFIKVGNTIVDKVICNGVVVWERMKDIDILAALCSGTLSYTSYDGPDRLSGIDDDGEEVNIDVTHTGGHSTVDLYVGIDSNFIKMRHYTHGAHDVPIDSSKNGANYLEFTYNLSSYNKLDFSGIKVADTSIGADTRGNFCISIDNVIKSNVYQADSHNDEESGNYQETDFSESIDVSSYTGIHTIRLNYNYYSTTHITHHTSAQITIHKLQLLS